MARSGSALRKRIWGWFFFDWASQPYNTLLLTFIFAPYVNELLGDGTAAQAAWGFGIGAAGLIIALLAPLLGAMADTAGSRMRWIWVFSAIYVLGSAGALVRGARRFQPRAHAGLLRASASSGWNSPRSSPTRCCPTLGRREEIGRISGNGWAFGYVGGLVALVLMLVFFAESATTGRTFVGLAPCLRARPATCARGRASSARSPRSGTRSS